MKKIICNNKLKKVLVAFIVFIILFNYILPFRVLANTIEDDLATVLESTNQYGQPAFGFMPGMVDLDDCKTVINTIESDNPQNSVTSQTTSGTLKIVISVTDESIVKKAFEGIFSTDSTYPSAIKDNAYIDKIEIKTLEGTTNPEPETGENQETPENPIEENDEPENLDNYDIEVEAEEMAEIFIPRLVQFDGTCILINVSDCKDLIQKFTSSSESSENKIYCDAGILYIEAISRGDIERIFRNYMSETHAKSLSQGRIQ